MIGCKGAYRARVIFSVWRKKDRSLYVRVLNGINIDGGAGCMVRERCAARYEPVIKGRRVICGHREVVVPAAIFAKPHVRDRNYREDRKPHLESGFKDLLDVFNQVFVDDELALMHPLIERIVF